MKRTTVLVFALATYAVFFATFFYMIGFVTGLVVSKTVSHGGSSVPPGPAVAADLALVALFGLQHSVMARVPVKRWLGRVVPSGAVRSVYVLATVAVLVVLFAGWRPLPGALWDLRGTPAGQALLIGQLLGWGVVLVSTFLIDHFALFGLRQAYAYFRGKDAPPPPSMVTPAFYKLVRHPIYVGFLIAFWSAPAMTVGRLVFALGMSSYILVGIQYEERDLVRHFGRTYEAYRRRAGMLLPRLRRASRREDATLPSGPQPSAGEDGEGQGSRPAVPPLQ